MVLHTIALGPAFDHLPDDTEETLVGSSLHQGAITALSTSLTIVGPRRGLPWFVGNQIKIVIPRQVRKPIYQPSPDILVHPTLTNASRSSLILATDGPPALIIEVASPSTALSNDLNLTSPTGKPGVYAALGVAEYIVFDPTAEFVTEQTWARRLGPHGYDPWQPEPNGHLLSALGISFVPHGPLLRVYDQAGRLVPIAEEMADLLEQRDREMAQALADRDRQMAQYAQELAERDRRLAVLEAELRRLRGK
jgi:Uma2 family endonuclease